MAQFFEVRTRCRLPLDAGAGGHHPRQTDGRSLFDPGAKIDGEKLGPEKDKLVARGVIRDWALSAGARREEEELIRQMEAEAVIEAPKKGGK